MTIAGKASLTLAVALAVSTFSSFEASAQQPPAPWVQWTVLDVEPSMVDEFLSVQRELTDRAKKAKTPWRQVIRTEVFGDTYRYIVATPVENLASFDRRRDPDAAATLLRSRLRRCIVSRKSYAVRTLPGIGNPLPEGEDEQPDLMVVNFVTVAPGREQDYMKVMTTDFFPHFDEAEMHHVTGALAIGGEGGFIHLFYVDNFAELDKGSPAMRALGADGAQAATAKLSGIVTRSELWLARRLPDLSYAEGSNVLSR